MPIRRKTLTLALLSVLLFSTVAGLHFFNVAKATTMTVPDDYLTIQAAIENSTQGDTILVKIGIYYETLVITKSIALIGEGQDTINVI